MGFKKFTRGVRRLGRRTTDVSRFKSDVGSLATEARQFFSNKNVRNVMKVAALIYGGWLLAGKGSLAVAAEGGAGAGTVGTASTTVTPAAGGSTIVGGGAGGGGGGGLIAEAGGAESLFTAQSLGETGAVAGSGGAGAGSGGLLSSTAPTATSTLGTTATTSTVGATTTGGGLTTAQATLAGYGIQALGGALQAAESAKALREDRKARKVTFAEPSKGRLQITRRVPTKKERGLIEVASGDSLKPKSVAISRVSKERRTNLFEAI